MKNKSGVITEQEISKEDVKSLPKLLYENSKDERLNKIHRVACLRKLLEHIPNIENSYEDQSIAYDLLSSLIHVREIPTDQNNEEIDDPAAIEKGEKYIQNYIKDFNYNEYFENVFCKERLAENFNEEENPYFKLQVFRIIVHAYRIRIDDPLHKYINEQYHVENDYMFSLDFMKYDILPDFIINRCIECMKNNGIIAA